MNFVEVIRRPQMAARPTHAVFDHDGTLSTIRYGWEKIMAPMMRDAIVGDGTNCLAERAWEAEREIPEFIDRTTGIQTIAQMAGLVEMVKRINPLMPVLSAAAYKKIYNDELMALVNSRIEPLITGRLAIADLEMKGATGLLMDLHSVGTKLHLVSGTDQEDVQREASLMCYGSLFETIHGSIGKVEVEAKSIILQRIFASIQGVPSVVVIGDGPVEIREGVKAGAFTIGVISDEVRRHGRNEAKRKRLIDAGADVLIPDFSDWKAIRNILCL